ncbi:MAG: hypothetical protein ABIH78_01325 [Candidatus Peregrinibacteria bacterium]
MENSEKGPDMMSSAAERRVEVQGIVDNALNSVPDMDPELVNYLRCVLLNAALAVSLAAEYDEARHPCTGNIIAVARQGLSGLNAVLDDIVKDRRLSTVRADVMRSNDERIRFLEEILSRYSDNRTYMGVGGTYSNLKAQRVEQPLIVNLTSDEEQRIFANCDIGKDLDANGLYMTDVYFVEKFLLVCPSGRVVKGTIVKERNLEGGKPKIPPKLILVEK